MRLVIFGGGGMLADAVRAATRRLGIECLALWRHDYDIADHTLIDLSGRHAVDMWEPAEQYVARDGDIWLNCAGVLRSDQHGYGSHSDIEMIRANALGPHVLASRRCRGEAPLIHVSTDSVFSGEASLPYRKTLIDRPDPPDLYGRTKLVGEGIADLPGVTVVRTSFMGPRAGLWRLCLDRAKEGATSVPGHAASWWSGSTVNEVAGCLVDMATEGPPGGLVHLATRTPISKADALEAIIEAYDLTLSVERRKTPVIYRGLEPTIELAPFREALKREVARQEA